MIRRQFLLGTGMVVALAAGALSAQAAGHGELCPIESGRISVLGNEFPAIQAVVARAEECAGEGVEFSSNLTTEHKNIQVPALSAQNSEYTSAVVANSSIVPLVNDDLIRPLDDLIEKWAPDLPQGQRIQIGGKTMAIAFMANAQHLYYREDILSEAGVEPPSTYEEVLDAAKMISEKGLAKTPYVQNSKTGWNLAEEFVNMYLGYGGEFFAAGSAEPAINNEQGVKALETLKALNAFAGPDFLTYDSNATDALWTSGDVAMMTAWGSRASSIMGGDNPDVSAATKVAAAPTVGGGSTPASTLWWDGFTIAKNISDEDAEATFRAMIHGTDPGVLEGNADKAVWLVEGYEPTEASAGVSGTAAAGAKPYPMLPYMAAMHTALGDELSDFLLGNESAEQALSDVEDAYRTAAREQGFLTQ